MNTADALAQALTSAALIRAAELAHGKQFTREQLGLYIEHYEGKYSRKIVEAGVGILVMRRLKKRSFLETIFGYEPKLSKEEQYIEDQAKKILETPGVRGELEKLIENDFRRIKGDDADLSSMSHNSARSELQGRIEALAKGTCDSSEGLFVSVIGPICYFRPSFVGNQPDRERLYASDTVIFELAAYLVCRFDSYLFLHHPDLRERYVQFMFSQVSQLFLPFLGLSEDQIADVINDRLQLYGRLIAARRDAQDFHDAISSAIHDTICQGSPLADLHDRPPRFAEALDVYAVKTALLAWELNFIPLIHQSIDAAVSTSRKNC